MTRIKFSQLLPGDVVIGATGSIVVRATVKTDAVVRIAWYGRQAVSEHLPSDRVIIAGGY